MFSRRNLLQKSVLGAATALVALFVANRAAHATANLTKSQAGYQDKPNANQHCETCSHFVAPNSCHLVEGEIAPQGWCRFYSVT